jgi:hypothetical protein
MERTEIDIEGTKHFMVKANDQENCFRAMNADVYDAYYTESRGQDYWHAMIQLDAETEEEAVEMLREKLAANVQIRKDPYYKSP